MNIYTPLLSALINQDSTDEAKIKAIQDINDKLENIVSAGDYSSFLEMAIPLFLKILQDEPVNFILESLEQQKRKIIFEIIYRLPSNDHLRPFIKQILATIITLLPNENENNALNIIKIILELLKQYRPPMFPEISQFLSFLSNKIKQLSLDYNTINDHKITIKYTSLTKEQTQEIIDKLYHPVVVIIDTLKQEKTIEQFTIIPKSLLSLKVLSELPIIVVIIYQLYKPSIHQEVGAMIPNMISFICLESPITQIATHIAQEIFCEFITAQVKILSFIAYIIRPFQESVNVYASQLVKGIMLLLKNCPPELANMRKEVLIALRHIQATHLRTKFIPHLSEILDQKLLLGKSITCYDTLCPLAYSSLADMIHHLRQNLVLSQLVSAISVFAKNIQDEILPWSIQNVSCKLLLNLVECIKIRAETENDPQGRTILVKILKVFILKFKSIAKVNIPEIIKTIKNLNLNQDRLHPQSKEGFKKFKKTTDPNFIPNHATIVGLCNQANDIKVLVKTLTTGIKTVTWGILTCKAGISSYVHQTKLLLPSEVRLYVSFVKNSLSVFEIYSTFNTTSPEAFYKSLTGQEPSAYNLNSAFKTTPNPFGSPGSKQQLSNKEEKENLDTFVGVFLMMNPMAFYEIFEPLAQTLVEVVLRNNNIIIVFNCFLASSTTSPPFTNIILNYLLKNMEDLGLNKEKANLFLKIFKLIFGSVSYISTENETILKHHLGYIVSNCIQLSMEAKEPFNYFLLLRYLFRFIGNGAHDSLYQEFLPLLPSLLLNLTSFQCDQHKSHLNDLFIELCLTVPVRLSSLLPHLPLLMDPLVSALNGSVNLVSQGLRTLELCVDNLQPEFLHEHLDPVRARLMQALWNLMRNSSNDTVTHSAFRLLGKFGGMNRKSLKDAQEFSSYGNMDGSGPTLGLQMSNSIDGLVTLPTDKIIDTAFDTLSKTNLDPVDYRYAWEIIFGFLTVNMSTENDDTSSVLHFLSHASFKENSVEHRYAKFKCWSPKARNVHMKALASLIIAASHKDLTEQVVPFMLSLVHHYTYVALTRQAGLFSKALSYAKALEDFNIPFVLSAQPAIIAASSYDKDDNGDDTGPNYSIGSGMEPEILVDAIKVVMGNVEKEFCKPAVRAICHVIDTALATLESYERVWQLPFFQYLSQQLISLCYTTSWYEKKGGCIGINLLVLKVDSKWLWEHHDEYIKALFFVIMDLTNEVSNGTVPMAQNVMEKLISLILALPSEDIYKDRIQKSLVKEMIQRISSPIKLVRNQSMKSLKLISKLAKKSIYDFTTDYKDIIYEIIPPKKHLLRHQSVNSQLGLMEAVTFCSSLTPPIFTLDLGLTEHRVFFTELISLCEAEDALLLRLPCYKNLNNDITELRKTALKTLISCQHVTQYQEKMFNILFKNLNSSNPEIQQTSFESLSKFEGLHLVDMETVHHSIRSLLLMLGDYRNLTPNFLTRLLHFAKLFPNTFNEKFCEHLLTHMITLLKVLSSKAGVKTFFQELKVCNEIVKIFCALPNAAANILEPLCLQMLALEPIFLNEIMIDLRHDLYLYLAMYPKETVTIFSTLTHLQEPAYYDFFLVMLKHTESDPLLKWIMNDLGTFQDIISDKAQTIVSNRGWYLKKVVATSSNITDDRVIDTDEIFGPLYTSLKTLCILEKKYPDAIFSYTVTVQTIRMIWNTKNFQNAYCGNESFSNSYWEIPKYMVHLLLSYFRRNVNEITLLFEMVIVFKNKYMESIKEFKTFINEELINYSVKWKRQLFFTFFESYNDTHLSEKVKAAIFQNLLIPIYSEAFCNGQTDQIIGYGTLGASPDTFLDAGIFDQYNIFRLFVDRFITTDGFFLIFNQDSSPGTASSSAGPVKCYSSPTSNELKVALLKFASLLVQYFSASHMFTTGGDSVHKKQNTLLRRLVTFAWPCLQSQVFMDPSVKYHGHLLLAHIVEKFNIHKRIVIQVFHSLLKASSSEAKNVIKKALEIIVPAIPSRVENGLTMLTYWTKKILLEEGHTLNQLAHILQLISSNRDIYYPARHSLIHLMLSAMSKLGFSGSNTTENRKLVVETAEIIIDWDAKTYALIAEDCVKNVVATTDNSYPTPPPPPSDALAVTGSSEVVVVMAGDPEELVTITPSSQQQQASTMMEIVIDETTVDKNNVGDNLTNPSISSPMPEDTLAPPLTPSSANVVSTQMDVCSPTAQSIPPATITTCSSDTINNTDTNNNNNGGINVFSTPPSTQLQLQQPLPLPQIPPIFSAEQNKPFTIAIDENVVNFLIRIICPVSDAISPAQTSASEYITTKCNELLLKALKLPTWCNVQLKLSWLDKMLLPLENIYSPSNQSTVSSITQDATVLNTSSTATPLSPQQMAQQKINVAAICCVCETLTATIPLLMAPEHDGTKDPNGVLEGPDEGIHSARTITTDRTEGGRRRRANVELCDRLSIKQLSRTFNWCLTYSMPPTPPPNPNNPLGASNQPVHSNFLPMGGSVATPNPTPTNPTSVLGVAPTVTNTALDNSAVPHNAPSDVAPTSDNPSATGTSSISGIVGGGAIGLSVAAVFYKTYGSRIGHCLRDLVRVLMKRIPPSTMLGNANAPDPRVEGSALQQQPESVVVHYVELKTFYGLVARTVADYVNAFEKFHGINLPILHHILSILASCCTDDPGYIDQYIIPFMRIFQKVVKDHINSCSVTLPQDANTSSTFTDTQLVTNVDVIIQCLDLVRYRISIMSSEMRKNFIGNIFIGLIEKTTDIKLLEYIIKLVGEWLKNKDIVVDTQAPSLREKSIILVKLTHCIEKRFTDNIPLNNQFLELILYVYQDEELSASELTTKLESAYLSGLKCTDADIRQKYFDHLDKNIGDTLYDRVYYVISSQNWEPLGSYFWIRQCIQIILMLADPNARLRNTSPSTSLPSLTSVFQEAALGGRDTLEMEEFLVKLSTVKSWDTAAPTPSVYSSSSKRFGNESFYADSEASSATSEISLWENDLLDIEGMMEKFAERSNALNRKFLPSSSFDSDYHYGLKSEPFGDEAKVKINHHLALEIKFLLKLKAGVAQGYFLKPLLHFCHSSVPLSEWLWINMLPRIYGTIPDYKKEGLNKEFQLFFLSGSHIQQKDCHPSVINVFFEAFSRCKPQIFLQAPIIRYLGKAHNLWHRALITLEKMYEDQGLNTEGSRGHVGMVGSVRQVEEDAFEFVPENRLEAESSSANTLQMETHDALADLYSVLGENDLVYSLWNKEAKYPETAKALSFQNTGQYLNATLLYETVIEKAKTDLTSNDESDFVQSDHTEFVLWENQWVTCLKELNEWDLLNDFASTGTKTYNPQVVLDCAWKSSDWNGMKEALTTVQKSCPRELAWKVNLCAGYLALSQSDDHHLNMMDRIVEIATGLAAREWKRLPYIVSEASHGPILRATQKVVELQEAAQLHLALHYHQSQQQHQQYQGFQPTSSLNMAGSFDNSMGNIYIGNGDPSINNGSYTNMDGLTTASFSPTTSSVPSLNLSEMRSIVKTWKNRFPIVADSFAYWHDIFLWRQLQYQYIMGLFESSSNVLNISTDSISNNNPLLLATHSIAQGLIKLATMARKQKLPVVALEILNKISIHSSIPIADCFRKVRQVIKCHLEMYNLSITDGAPNPRIITRGLEVIDDTNVKYFTKDMVSEILAYRGHCNYILGNTEEANKAFSGAVQLSDSHVKAWGMWGEFLADNFWSSISQYTHSDNPSPNYYRTPILFNLAKSALTCLLQACRHSNEIKVAKYISQILWLLKFDDDKCILTEMVDKYLTTIPSYHWLNWVPQLLMALERKDGSPIGRHVMNIVTHVGRTYPQAIFFPVRTAFLSLKMELKETSSLNGNTATYAFNAPKENFPSFIKPKTADRADGDAGNSVENEATRDVVSSNGDGRSREGPSENISLAETDAITTTIQNVVTSTDDRMEIGVEKLPNDPNQLSNFTNMSIRDEDRSDVTTVRFIGSQCSSNIAIASAEYAQEQDNQSSIGAESVSQSKIDNILLANEVYQATKGIPFSKIDISNSVHHATTSTKMSPSTAPQPVPMIISNGNADTGLPNQPSTPVNLPNATATTSPASSPIFWCRRILHILRELHPTTLYTLEGLVDQLIWFRETWFEELLQYLKQLRNKCYIIWFQVYKQAMKLEIEDPDPDDSPTSTSTQPKPLYTPYGDCSADLDIDAILSYLTSIMNKLLTTFETGIENLASLASKLTTSSTESSIRRAQATMKDPMFPTLKARFLDDFSFVRHKLTLEDVEYLLLKLRAWIYLLENKVIHDLPESYLMDDKCSLLNNWLLNDVEIELPGETNYAKPSQYCVKICQFSPVIRVETKCGFESCRKVSLRGSDGKIYSYLVLNDNLFLSPLHSHTLKPWEKRNSSHLRMVTAQIMRYLNIAFGKNKEASRRDLSYRLSRMVTISPHMTLVETDESMLSLRDIYKQYCKTKSKSKPEEPLIRYYKLLDGFHEAMLTNMDLRNDIKGVNSLATGYFNRIFGEIQAELVPPTVLQHYSQNTFISDSQSSILNCTDYWTFRKSLVTDSAILMFFEYVFRTFPLCPDGITYHRRSNSILGVPFSLQIDLGQILCESLLEKDDTLHIKDASDVYRQSKSETPVKDKPFTKLRPLFRLTPNYATFFGSFMLDGPFQFSIRAVARCVSDKKLRLDSMLRAYLNDLPALNYNYEEDIQATPQPAVLGNMATELSTIPNYFDSNLLTLVESLNLINSSISYNLTDFSVLPQNSNTNDTLKKLVTESVKPENLALVNPLLYPWL